MANKMIKIIFLLVVICNYSCSQTIITKSQGVIRESMFSYDNKEKRFVKEPQVPSHLFWFLDNYVIQEVRGLSTKSLNGEIVSIDTSVTHYTFYDFANKRAFYYDTLGVNAKLLKEFYHPIDSLIDGWNFQRTFPLLGRENLTAMPDTIIQGHSLKRLQTRKRFISDSGTIEHVKIGYIRTDIKHSLFHLDKPLDDSLHSTMVRMDFWVKPTNLAMSSSFEFLRNKLTKNELSVFEAWIKRARSGK